MMHADDVVDVLNDPDRPLSQALRMALQVPQVNEDISVAEWIEQELTGYPDGDAVPDYRRVSLTVVASLTNGAWFYKSQPLATSEMPDNLRAWAERPSHLIQGVAEFEHLLQQGDEFHISWPADAVSILNAAIARGGMSIHGSYHALDAWHHVPASVPVQIMERVRMRLANQLAAHVTESGPRRPSTPTLDSISVSGSQNIVTVNSPSSTQNLLVVGEGDIAGFESALESLGMSTAMIRSLRSIVDAADEDQPTRLAKAMAWTKTQAAELPVEVTASMIGAVILGYLGFG